MCTTRQRHIAGTLQVKRVQGITGHRFIAGSGEETGFGYKHFLRWAAPYFILDFSNR
jgi:hypothetical protein